MNQNTQTKFAAILAAAQQKANEKTTVNFVAPKTEQVKVLGQLVTPGTKLHTKLTDQVKQFNDLQSSEVTQPTPEPVNNAPELSEMTFNDLLPVTPVQVTPEPVKPVNDLKIVDYSERAFAVISTEKPSEDILNVLRLYGTFNRNLKCGKGWIFSKRHLATIKAELNLS